MKQKLALSCALIHKPTVLFLDEPTTGVDPVSRKEFWEMLKRLKTQGITILVSTPYMDEAMLCDRIALIQDGSFLGIETPQDIITDFKEVIWSAKSHNMSALLSDLRACEGVKSCFAFGTVHHLTVDPSLIITALEKKMQDKGHFDIEISEITPTIEDCYMQLASRPKEV